MDWQQTAFWVIGLLIGVILHEYMHGRVADWRGDHTARNAGRLTLNPIPHIDPFGSILVPLVLIVIRSPIVFGYAKPVPINPFFLKKPKRDMVLIALAGPLTNFSIAFAIAIIGLIVHQLGVHTTVVNAQGFVEISEVFKALIFMAEVNIFLGVFNLIPVPPLDGSHILEYFLPPLWAKRYDQIAPFGFVIILGFLILAGSVLFTYIVFPILRLVGAIMGLPTGLI